MELGEVIKSYKRSNEDMRGHRKICKVIGNYERS